MNIRDSIVAVLNERGKIVGTGFLVGEKLVLTCAHVIVQAGAIDGDSIQVRFEGRVEKLNAFVVSEYWRDIDKGDVAVLRLENVPEGITPLPLGNAAGSAGHDFYAYGYATVTGVQGIGARGKIVDIVDSGRLVQLTSQEPDHGMSGGPVLDEQRRVVIGMVTKGKGLLENQNLRNTQTTFATSIEIIREVCTELQLTEICPYRSLEVFNEEDALFFFGREKVVQKLLDSLKREPRFLAVLGPSGSGKSSVVRAGLIPALRQGKVPGSQKWEIVTIRPANDPFEQLASFGFINPRAGIESSVKAWLANRPDNTRLVLFIDQFEELFVSTLKDIRLNFIAELARSLDSHCSITVAFTLRDDFYSKFLGEAINLTGWLERGLVNIPPTLDKDDIRTIIIQPAQSVGIIFDEGLVDVIINDSCEVDKKRGFARSTILPLLEFTLTQLWQHREKNQLTHSAYRNNGEVVGSLTIWADHVYYELTEFERTLARNILTGLVHLGVEKQGIPDSRSTRPINSLVRLDDNVAFEVIDKLIRSRILLSFRNVENGDESIEIIHDAFLIEWSLLRKWLDEEQFVLRLRETVREAAVDWENGTRDESYLIHRGKRLNELIAISSNSRFVFTISEQAYINACVLIHEKESISETTIIKDQLATRTSLAWAGLVTSVWQIEINRDVVMIRNVVDQIRQERDRDNELSELSNFNIRLDKIEQLAKRIGDVTNLTHLSSEDGVKLVFIDKIVKERLSQIIEFRTVGKVKFELQLDPKPLAKVRISPKWFTRSFDILIDNALNAVSNRDLGMIVVSTVYGQRIVEVKVQDNGLGIDKEIRENLFRTSIPKKSGEKGAGIGLLLASAVVQSYGGNIRLESSSPLGTSMVISLPLA